ncbi:MAG: transglutaminase-like domain-containing protein, partial [Methanosarcina sp.]
LTINIKYTITVDSDVVPEGEIIRCWLPFPRKDMLRQQEIKLLGTSAEKYSIAHDSAVHSTIYMEQKSVKDKNAIFSVSFSYKTYAQHFRMDSIHAMPFDHESGLYKEYTTEQLPHISFTPEIRSLADNICGNETDPLKIVSKVWLWFKDNIPWTGAPEYSIIDNISSFTCSRKTGDCGMQTFLFMSMLRYKGIPVRWQSGWMIPPKAENLHDWCEVWYEGTGWVPVDVSYGLQNSANKELREYYVSGLDAYRMIVNDGVAGQLYPEKKFLRSEPYDFQRGEVEWSGGNIYFNKWKYDIEIEYSN